MNSIYIKSLRNKSFTPLCNLAIKNILELKPSCQLVVPSRTTFVLKRKYPPRLIKKGYEERKLKGKDYVYELVENTEVKKQPLVSVILNENIDGVGVKGECVTVKRSVAYNKLLVTGLADYATPEALKEAEKRKTTKLEEDFSTPYAPLMAKYLENMILSVVMNKEVEWTLEPWHIRVAFRKAGVHVPSECIQLPDKPISGPNLDLESKIFCITVTINNKEKATVRCRLHHWSTDISNKIQTTVCPFTQPLEPIFPEDYEKIKSLPVIKYKTLKQAET